MSDHVTHLPHFCFRAVVGGIMEKTPDESNIFTLILINFE
jgi:hypothetical protein